MTHLQQLRQHLEGAEAALERTSRSLLVRRAFAAVRAALIALDRHEKRLAPADARRQAMREALDRIETGKTEAVGDLAARLRDLLDESTVSRET